MDKGGRYFQWLTYVVIIAIFGGVMLSTFGKAALLVLKNL